MAKRKTTIKHAEIVRAFAERLRGIRQASGLTQRDLASKANVTFSYVSRLEAGGAAPGIDLLERLARALNVSVVDLLPAPPQPENTETHREQVKQLFDAVLMKSGNETLSMLKQVLVRLAESTAISR
jgi:transcriptional regulator with XRE-family HTH domain